MIFNILKNSKSKPEKKSTIRKIKVKNWDQKFYFKCGDCRHIFYAKIGTPCPNCGSIDVRIITESKLLKYFRR